MDQNNPARFLDTAYNALKANPNATGQILQAAAQGQPVGLRGLAAAAAQQNQQEAQKAAMAQNIRGPQPSVIQQLAGASGIMGQLPSNLQLASAPTGPAPEEMPQQMMAGGGLVAFAGGGNVLPPDVIDAIQSHFAEGGDVRGFAGGEEIMAILRGAADELPYGELGSFIEGPGATPRPMPADYGPMGSFVEGAPREAPSKLDLLKKFLGKEVSPAELEAGIASKVKGAAGKGLSALSKYGSVLGAAGKVAGPLGYASSLYEVGNIIADPQNRANFSEDWQREMPSWLGGRGEESQAAAPTTAEITPDDIIDVADVDGRGKKIETWKPEAHDGHEVSPRQRVPVEAQKVSQEFKEAKKDVPSAAVTPASESQGLGGLDQGREAVDYIKSLLGEKKLSPEISQKLADLQDKARTSTIIQSVLGGLAGGLSNPYGGRFALGSAALNALGGYQRGIGSEEDIQRKALDIERAYADQPADLQTAAAKEYFDMMKEKARALSAERVAEGKSESALDRLIRSEEGKDIRAQLMAGQKGAVTEGQKIAAWNEATKQATKEIETEYLGATPPAGELERRTQQKYRAALNSLLANTGEGLGAGQAQQQQYGLGAQPTGRSIIGGKLMGSSPQ